MYRNGKEKKERKKKEKGKTGPVIFVTQTPHNPTLTTLDE